MLNLSSSYLKSAENGDIGGVKNLENDCFPEINEISGVQQEKKQQFNNESTRFSSKKASYRKISVYTKSMKRYRLERERRRQVRALAEQGYTQKQIANKLGVCTRTIKRDWDKIRPYVKGQFVKLIRAVVDERQQEFERRYEGLTVNEEFRLLKQDLKEADKKVRSLQSGQKRQEQRQQPVRQLDYVFDLDSPIVDGFPRIILPFDGSNMQFVGNFEIKFYAIKNGEKRELCNVGVSTNTTSPHN